MSSAPRLVRMIRVAAGGVIAISPFLIAAPAQAQFRDWAMGSGDWTNPFAWSPFGPPAATDIARLGAHFLAENSFVDLNSGDTIAGLEISDGMILDTNGFPLTVNGNTIVTDRNEPPGPVVYPSRLRIGNGLSGTDFRTDDLTITNDAWVTSSGFPVMQVNGRLSINSGSSFVGNGSLNFTSDSGPAIVNNGRISAYDGTLFLTQLGDARFDLDGVTGQGAMWLYIFDTNTLTVNGTELTDDFSGHILLVAGSSLFMNLDAGWVADAASTITISGGGTSGDPALIAGSDFTIGGLLEVVGEEGRLNVSSSTVTIQPSATLDVGDDDSVYFYTPTTVEGGEFIGGTIIFAAETRIEGGTFSTPSELITEGVVQFAGPTTWVGNAHFSGNAAQVGNAIVSASTTITADIFDMDGVGGVTGWNINASLTVAADEIDYSGSAFNGTLNIGSPLTAAMTINLDQPAEFWTMAGEMSLVGSNLGFISRLNGSPVWFEGGLTLPSNRAQINADAHFRDGSVVDLTAESATLRLNGTSSVQPGVAFNGLGTLRNGPPGEMTIDNTANLQQVGLVNEGVLHPASGPGTIFVDRFENRLNGTLRVELGGTAPGVGHDLLIVTDGTATLAGTLDVRLLGAGAGQYTPQVGDLFTVLTASDGIVGTFDSVPDTLAGGDLYQWDVTYNANDVTIELVAVQDNIAPCAIADLAQPWGILDLADITTFIVAFTSSDPTGDLAPPFGLWDLGDVIAFVVAFQNGCP